jgi:hypothetical protein
MTLSSTATPVLDPAAPSPATVLATYSSADDRPREIVVLSGRGGSALVVDRDELSGEDPRLLAHLWPDEPLRNALIVCTHFLADARACLCRQLNTDDLELTLDPEADEWSLAPRASESGSPTSEPIASHREESTELTDARGDRYRLEPVIRGDGSRELRWTRRRAHSCEHEVTSLRTVVAALEDYEPARSMTLAQLAAAGGRARPCVGTLRAELRRLRASRVVLNRRLREAVLSAIAEEGLSMSQIAIRCGRVKRDARGRISGETSWLGRRLGLLPEGGADGPTPWARSDVLALIAWRGLGISPREVEW